MFLTLQAVGASALDPQLKHLNLREYLFTAEEEGLIDDILKVLKPLKTATTFISAEKQPTASKVLPTLAKLRMEMIVNETDSHLAAEMKSNIIENLNRRYTDDIVSKFLLKASFLDPRYKSLHNLATPKAVLMTKQAIRDMCAKVVDHQEKVCEANSPNISVKQESEIVDTADSNCEEPLAKKLKTKED